MTPAHDAPPRTASTAWTPPDGKPPLSARLMRAGWRRLPARLHEVGLERGLAVPAADGSPLVTDHYFPRAQGDFPTLLVRSPYGRGLPWGPQYGMLFAEQGFHVVLQSCRGTGGSGGRFHLWRNEAGDGAATVAWLREQPWFDGTLGTIGPSYLGYTQWALALEPPPELRAMVVQLGLHDPRALFHADGALQLEHALLVGTAITHQHQGALPFLRATLRLRRLLRGLTPSTPPPDSHADALGGVPAWLDEAIAAPDPNDPYWGGASTSAAAEVPGVPTALITGWYDTLAGQTFEQYARLRRAAGRDSSLLVGPWTHTSALGKGWPEVFAESLAWLRAHLCSDPSGLRPTAARVHVGGQDAWRDLDDWPPPRSARPWFPAPDGHLIRQAPDGGAPLASFTYDPAEPTPSVGGPLLSLGAGPRDNTTLEARGDVLTFTGPPLTEPVDVLGPVLARLSLSADGRAVIFTRLCDVDPRGRSTNVCDGPAALRTDGAAPVRVTATMGHTAYRFAAGHRIRWQISAAPHPRFAPAPHPTDGAAVGPVRITVHADSALVLPDGAPGDVVTGTPPGAVGLGSPTRGGAAR